MTRMTITDHHKALADPNHGHILRKTMRSDIRSNWMLIELALTRINTRMTDQIITTNVEAILTSDNDRQLIRLHQRLQAARKSITRLEATLNKLGAGQPL